MKGEQFTALAQRKNGSDCYFVSLLELVDHVISVIEITAELWSNYIVEPRKLINRPRAASQHIRTRKDP